MLVRSLIALLLLLVAVSPAIGQVIIQPGGSGGGGAGSVTHTTGALTSGKCVIGNGADDLKVDPSCSTDGAGTMTLLDLILTCPECGVSVLTTADLSTNSKCIGGTGCIGSDTGDILKARRGGSATEETFAFLQGDLGGTQALPQVNKLTLTAEGQIGTQALTTSVANEGATGTTVKLLAKLTGAPSTAIKAGTSDTTGVLGIVVAGAGTTGNARIATTGQAPCTFDAGGVTAGHYVIASTVTAANCRSGGATYPTTGVQVLGRALQTVASGDATVVLFGTEAGAGTGVGTVTSVSANTQHFTVATATSTPAISWKDAYVQTFSATPTFNFNNGHMQSITVTAAVTSSSFTNGENGGRHCVIVIQDGIGGHTFAWPGSTINAPAVVTTAGAFTKACFDYDGASFIADVAGGNAPKYNALTDPDGNLALSMGSNTISKTWGDVAGSGTLDRGVDGNNAAGDGPLMSRETGTSSLRIPARFCAQGTTKCVEVEATTGGLNAKTALKFSGYIAPTALSANTDDWNPTGLSTASAISVTATAAINLTGIQGGASGRVLTVCNIGANTITLKNDTTSTAAYRLLLGADLALAQHGCFTGRYDATAERWRPWTTSGSGGGVGGSGTSGKIARFTAGTTLADSSVADDGTKPTLPTGSLVTAGTGSGTGTIVTVLSAQHTATATTGAAEEVLLTYTLPANTLSANGKAIRVTAVLTGDADSATKRFRLRWGPIAGGTACSDRNIANAANEVLHITCTIIRRGAGSQALAGVGTSAVGVNPYPEFNTATRDETATNVIVITGEGATGDISAQLMIVEMLN